MKIILFAKIFVLSMALSSCGISRFSIKNESRDSNNIDIRDQNNGSEVLEISISCGKGSIKELLDEGWKVKKEYSEEKVCSWKSVPANKSCDMEKDKGCKITKPDKIGKETFYLLGK